MKTTSYKRRFNYLILLLFVFSVIPSKSETPATSTVRTVEKDIDQNGIHKHVIEEYRADTLLSRDEDVVSGDRKMHYIFRKLFRGSDMVYASSRDKVSGKWVEIYFHGGKEAFLIGDDNGSGVFVTSILFDSNEKPVEAFKRENKTGIIRAMTTQEMISLQNAFSFTDQSRK